ncbi:MAG: HAMP domain-containing protein [Sphingobacteriaceae bacterium]|nr:MAG: HAMP domain-containing protein [Sphingobacteriaceae bacterium]
MKVQNKLRFGFGFLFVVVLFFGMLSIFYVNEISDNAKVILKDNYKSLNYAREMRAVLDENSLPLNPLSAQKFETQLIDEEQNLTEPGEAQLVKKLHTAFTGIKTASATTAQLTQNQKLARSYLRRIEVLNMNAIFRKNDRAQASVKKTVLYLGLAGSFTFLVLFSFSVNFPGFITNPLHTLLEGIREISLNNYSKRIHFDNRDEFAEVAAAFNEMAARLNDWENSNLSKIRSQKLRIETIIEQMNDAIIGINEQQEILFINPAAKNLIGLQDQKPEGKLAAEIIKTNDLFRSVVEGNASQFFKLIQNGKDAHFQLEIREILVPNLEPRHLQVLNTATKSAGKVYLLRNITEFKERDEAKTNFIATVSHELKTPISAMKLSLKLLKDSRVGELNDEQSQLVQNINEDAERLLKITSELLNLAQAETGNIQLNFRPVQPEKLINFAIEAVQFEAGQKGVYIEKAIDQKLPEIQADIEKTAWVMINFLSNALRYSAAASKIVIKVTAKNSMVEFSVQDFGKGIEPQYQERLFERYFQVPADNQNKSGSGLGLAISKEFISAQNGVIGVESEVGKGSRFYFKLPVFTPESLFVKA